MKFIYGMLIIVASFIYIATPTSLNAFAAIQSNNQNSGHTNFQSTDSTFNLQSTHIDTLPNNQSNVPSN